MGPGVLLEKDRGTGKILNRYSKGAVLLDEKVINPEVPLAAQAVDLKVLDKIMSDVKTSAMTVYEVEKGSGPVNLIQIKSKDYFSLTEDYRKARH
jgi:hypothetical protein